MLRENEVLLVATFADERRAQAAVEKLIEKGFPMDMLSLLGRVHASGDDDLGLGYPNRQARMLAWARQGALWGGVGGLVAGAVSVFAVPGIGTVLVAGPLIEALLAAIGGAAAMAGVAAVTELAVAFQRMGIPHQTLDRLHRSIEHGHYLVLLRMPAGEAAEWKGVLGWSGSDEVEKLPPER